MSDTDQMPTPPYNTVPFIMGDDNGDPLRLVQINYYTSQQGVQKGQFVWARGTLLERRLDSGAVTEVMSVNTPLPDAGEDDRDRHRAGDLVDATTDADDEG